MDPIRLTRETTTRDFLAIIFRRKLVIGAVILLSTLLTAGRSLRAPVIYWSTCQVLLQRGQRTSALETRIVLRPWEEVVNSELNIAQSEPVVRRAREMLARRRSTPGRELTPAEVLINRGRLEAVPEGTSSVINIRYGSLEAGDAREVAAAVTDAYLEIHRELYRLPDARKVIETHLTNTEEELARLSQERRDFLTGEGIIAVEEERTKLLELLAWTQSDLTGLRSEIAGKEEQIRGMRRALAEREAEDVPLATGVATPGRAALVRMREDLVHLRGRRSDLLSRYNETHGDVRAVNESIEAIRAELVRSIEGEIGEQEASLAVLRAQEAPLIEAAGRAEERLARMPELERRVRAYDRQIAALEEYYRDFQRGEFSLTVVEVTGRDFKAVLLSPASRSVARNPRDLIRLSLGPGLGLLAGLGLALFLERFDHSVHTPEDVEDFLDLPVLGSVSEAPWRPRAGIRGWWRRYRL